MMNRVNEPAQIPHNLHHPSAFQAGISSARGRQVVLRFQDNWWARKDLTFGSTDYESVEKIYIHLQLQIRGPIIVP
jgi:hypothetical protein